MSDSRPLVVDLDGTLLVGDLLAESASDLLTHHPLLALGALRSLRRGRNHLKRFLADHTAVDTEVLPLNEPLLAWLQAEREGGRQLVLASAGEERLVTAVARRLGIFDLVIGTTEEVNLKGEAKRDVLVARYGESGYDYVGNEPADVAVWRSAAVGHVVGDEALARRAAEVTEMGRRFPRPRAGVGAAARALRPQQWVKNALVLVPLIAAQMLGDAQAVGRALVAVLAFCLVSSAVYVLNDLADVSHDRRHPRKQRRPFASGELGLSFGWGLWPVLGIAGLALSALLPGLFVVTTVGYFALAVAYTFWAKGHAVVDVITLGGLYTLRIVAGAAAIAAPLSNWLLTFSMLFFLSLALIKRVGELTRLRASGADVRGRGYETDDLELLSSYGVATSVGSVVVFGLYLNDPKTSELYATPALLWPTVPVLLAWLMRSWLLAHRGQIGEDPILYALSERASWVAVVLVALTVIAAKVITL